MSGPGRAPDETLGSDDAAPRAVAGMSASAATAPISFPRIRTAWKQIPLSSAPVSAELLWEPTAERVERATITRFARKMGLPEDYAAIWRWSVEDVERFWAAVWDFFAVDGSYDQV